MDTGILLLLTVLLSIPLFIIQRSESKRRFIVFLFALVPFELIRRYVWYRDVHSEAVAAVIIALVINFLFWAMIGRYNPVGSSDRIKVYGLND
jgi:hypothetical protein